MITNHARSMRTKCGTEFAETIKKQLLPAKLSGIEAVKRVGTSNGTCWILVAYKKTEAAKMVADIITREASEYPEFTTMDALTLMNQQLGAITTKPEVITH
jgi:hypothetical protein